MILIECRMLNPLYALELRNEDLNSNKSGVIFKILTIAYSSGTTLFYRYNQSVSASVGKK